MFSVSSIVVAWSGLVMSAWLAAQAQGLRPESKLVEQSDAPVLVTGYRAEYVKRTSDSPESIRHEIEYRNRSSQRIVAIQFGLVSFDLWNEFLAKTAGLSTEVVAPKARERGSWSTLSEVAFSFNTAVVYVERVRFESGEIWAADLDPVIAVMRTIQKNFDPANLTRK